LSEHEDEDEEMNPSQLEQLVKDRQAELLATRGPRRRRGRSQVSPMRVAQTGLEKTGLGLIRLGVRLAGPEPLSGRPQSAGAGMFESPC
jgi:hypothetical protein